MRIESFKVNTRPNNRGLRASKWIASLLIRLYAHSLRLYPAAFRADFADEMLDVFAMTLREARGTLAFLTIVWREVAYLPINIICVRQQKSEAPTSSINVWRARHVTRWSSMILSLFILYSLINPFVSPQTFAIDGLRLSLFFVLLFFTSLSMLLAWRWERLGGLLTIGGGITLGAFLIFYIGYFRPAEISLIGLSFIGILWALPFVTFGVMFYLLSQYPVRQLTTL